jgi:transketolase
MPVTGGLENAVEGAAATRCRCQLAQQLRVDSARASATAGLGHPASSMSAAELMAVLLDGHLRLDFCDPRDPRRDHLIFSKGRAWPLYYAMLKTAGAIRDEELLGFPKFGSWPLGDSLRTTLPTDVATGLMGQGLPIGVGLALAGRRLDRLPSRIWVLCGDTEMAEDSTWEAFCYGGRAALDNLTVVVDANRLGHAGEIMLGRDLQRARAFGWHAEVIDGHDVDAIDRAYREAATNTGRPAVIFARTRISRGGKTAGGRLGYRGMPSEDPRGMIAGLRRERLRVHVARPGTVRPPHRFEVCGREEPPRWDAAARIATAEAYGEALAALGHRRGDVVALDGEVSSATCSEPFAQAHPERYFEMFMAERPMIAAAAGMQARGWAPFASILSRECDFGHLAASSRANLRLVGSCADLTIGEDGGSFRVAPEDFAALREVAGSAVLHPSDANQVPPLVAQMADRPGISYMRTLRSKTVVRTHPDEDIRIGGSRLVRGSDHDYVTVVACGVTVAEAEEAAGRLERDGVRVRVIDCYSIKPIDADALRAAARQTAVIVTVEDHWAEGGLGEAVLSALADEPHRPPILRLAARDIPNPPKSGHPAELLHAAGIDAAAIVRAVLTHLTPLLADAAASVDVLAETAGADGVPVRSDPIEPESVSSSTSGERGRRRLAYGWRPPHQGREQRRHGHCRVHQPANRH